MEVVNVVGDAFFGYKELVEVQKKIGGSEMFCTFDVHGDG